MNNTWPVRFAPHLNPRLFAPHLGLLLAYCALSAVGLYLHLAGTLSWFAGVSLLLAMAPRHSIVLDDTTVHIRHWLWTWRLKREDITDVSWGEQERYLTVGHARGSSLLALRAPVRALALRRREGSAIFLFGGQAQLEQIRESLRANNESSPS